MHTQTNITLTVTGMTCGSCRAHVERALAGVEGVESVQVDLGAGRAVVGVAAGAAVSASRLVGAVEEAGYAAVVGDADARGLRVLGGSCCSM